MSLHSRSSLENRSGLMDRGDSFHLLYLGARPMAQSATGLGVLQKPLKELYFVHRREQGNPGQPRQLVMSSQGMAMVYRDGPQGSPKEDFYPITSLLTWDAVQFVTVRGQGKKESKKVKCAFEPLDNDHSRNKDNLFVELDKKFHFLQQTTHPAMFMCVARKQAGVKSLEVHVFVCSSVDEALGLVRALNTIQLSHNSEQAGETGVFGYRPFGAHETVSPAVSGQLAAALNARLNHSPSAVRRSPKPAERQRPKSMHLLSPTGLSLSDTPNRNSPTAGHRVLQLTQEDFVQNLGGVPMPEPTILTEYEEETTQYENLDHIGDTLPGQRRFAPNPKAAPVIVSRTPSERKPGIAQSKSLNLDEVLNGQRQFNRKSASSHDLSQIDSEVDEIRPSPLKGFSYLGQGPTAALAAKRVRSPPQRSETFTVTDMEHRNKGPSPQRLVSPSYEQHIPELDGSQSLPRESTVAPHYKGQASHSPSAVAAPLPPTPVRPQVELPRMDSPPRDRPVAMVQPRKVTGVKVLPSGSLDDSSTVQGGSGKHFGAPPQRSKSQHFPGDFVVNYNSKDKQKKNWQMQQRNAPTSYPENTISPGTVEKSKAKVSSVLNVSQNSKDKEIASMMENMHFDYDQRTMPAGKANFEKSLGYLP